MRGRPARRSRRPGVVQIVSGGYAGTCKVKKPALPGRPYWKSCRNNELRQLEIIRRRTAFWKAAMASKDARVMATAIRGADQRRPDGKGRRRIWSRSRRRQVQGVGTLNDQNLVELTTTWIPNAVYGDMLYEIRHLNYKDFGGVKFPTTIHVHQGDPVFNPAHNMMEIRVSNVQTNVAVPAMPVPDNIRQAAAAPVRADAEVADGVWSSAAARITASRWIQRHIAMIEARSTRAIARGAGGDWQVAPNKLVRYIINTHHHSITRAA